MKVTQNSTQPAVSMGRGN